MLRPFPPKNAPTQMLNIFQTESDAILRSVSSLPIPTPEPTSPYDDFNLDDLTNLSKELLADFQNQLNKSNQSLKDSVVPKFVSDIEAALSAMKEKAKTVSSDTEDGFILKMVFDIVPIGVNIAAKGNTIAAGLKDTSMGIVNLLKNIALLTVNIGLDSILFAFQFAIYLFKLLLCTVQVISNFPKCLTFYLIDILMFVVLVAIVSILFIIDIFFMVKYLTGTSCIELFIKILRFVEMVDNAIYSTLSLHVVHYPNKIINLCYTCSMMGDTSGFKKVASRLFSDIFIDIPSDIGGPIGDTFNGIGEIFSFFNI